MYLDRRRILLLTQLMDAGSSRHLRHYNPTRGHNPLGSAGAYLSSRDRRGGTHGLAAIVRKWFPAEAICCRSFEQRRLQTCAGRWYLLWEGPGVAPRDRLSFPRHVPFSGVIPPLYVWKRPCQKRTLPPEHMFGAILQGGLCSSFRPLTVSFYTPAIFSFLWLFPAGAITSFGPADIGVGAIGYAPAGGIRHRCDCGAVMAAGGAKEHFPGFTGAIGISSCRRHGCLCQPESFIWMPGS